ncbi:reverse transcriptase domain-containing protein [Tanacetum coccineum]
MGTLGTNSPCFVGLATNQSLISLDDSNGMLGIVSNGTPFLMYPRFVQLFLNKQLEGVDRPQDFIPSVSLPSKVFTFMRKHSTKFSCRITPLTPSMLEVVSALAAEEEQSTSPHSRAASSARVAQGTPTQSAAHSQRTASVQGTASFQGTATSQGTAPIQRTADFQGTAEPHDAASIPKSPNDYTPTDASQTSGGDEGLLDIYALNREVRRLKKQTLSQAKQILKLKAKLKKLSKFVAPVVKHHALWVENQNLKKQKRRRKKHKKKVSSVKLGRNKDEGTLSEEHNVQEEDTTHHFFDDTADQDAAVTPDLERKSDGTEEVNIEEKEASNVKSGETEELDLETTQSTARQGTITPRTLNFEDEAGPSSPLRPIQVMDSEEQHNAAEVLVAISRPRGTDPKDKGKGILVEEPKKKKMTLQQIRALETTNDEEVARKIQAEWDAEEERKRFEELKKTKPKTTLRKPTSLAQERNQMMSFLKGQGYKNLQKLKYPQMKELYDKVQASIKDSFKDFANGFGERNGDVEKRDAKRRLKEKKATILKNTIQRSLKQISTSGPFEPLLGIYPYSMVIDRQDLYHLYRVVDDYYEHIPPTGLGSRRWEILRMEVLHESHSGVHTLEIEDGTMIHMLAERRYPLSRELMIRMLDHGMEVEDETETAITLIHRSSCGQLKMVTILKTTGLPALQSTRMTLELANCSLCVPKGIARDVLVPVGRFTFPADFVVVDFECNYRVPLILGRPFLRTARVLIDVHGEEIVIRDGMERINDESSSLLPTSTIVEEFESLLGEIIRQKEEVKGISDPVARRKACFLDKFRIINQGRVIHSPKVASIGAISHIFPNNNLEDSFKMGNEDLNFIPNKELDKEDLIPIPRESKIGKDW